MFYVYHGYVSPDRCDCSEQRIYELTECADEASVLKLKREFEAETNNPEVSGKVFRVIQGTEKRLEPETKILDWRLV